MFTRGGKFPSPRKMWGDRSAYPQETRRKYCGPFAGIATLAFLTD